MAALIPREHRRHPINASEDVGALRRAVAALSAGSGLRAGEAELVATELGTNLLEHAEAGGYVLCRPTTSGIELVSVDSGPGMNSPRVSAAAGSAARPAHVGLSAGLAGVRRMSTDYDVYSDPRGTVVLARIGGRDLPSARRWRCGGVNVPLGGSGPSGDIWAVATQDRLTALVVDGLGHGDAAAAAAAAAAASFDKRPTADPAQVLGRAHEAMRGTRGGVAAVTVIDPDAGQLTFAGVGNIAGQIGCNDSKKQHLLSHPGTLGTQLLAPKVHVRQHRWVLGATLVLVSDGIRSGWELSAYPGLREHDPVVVAAVLHRDFTRSNDDATVLVVQETR